MKKMNIKPLGDKVLIKALSADETEKKSKSGIIIPDTISKEKPEQGKVIAVGAGKYDDNGKLIPMSVKVGDRVLFSKYGYDEVKMDGEEFLIVSENQILAIIK
jgi:chaperonin GroES